MLGHRRRVDNSGGGVGAWIADFSSTWSASRSGGACAGLRVWLPRWPVGCAASIGCRRTSRRAAVNRSRIAFWFGFLLLLSPARCRVVAAVPARIPLARPGGVLGYLVGPLSMQWLGFTGSALIAIAAGVIGSALVFRFSWRTSSSASVRARGAVRSPAKRPDRAGLALGQRPRRARGRLSERDDDPDRRRRTEHLAPQAPRESPPVQIEPAMTEVPRATRARNARCRCSRDLPDSNLPPVAARRRARRARKPSRAETLEFTSRLIEKKLPGLRRRSERGAGLSRAR